MAALAAEVEQLERRLTQREDELDVRKLQYLYGYLIDKCMYDQVIELFTDDCEVRFFGGVWKGKAGARRLYIDRFRKRFTHDNNGPIDGFLLDHPQLQDIIDIQPDGVTALARARSTMQAGRHRDHADPDKGLGVRQWWEGGIYENTYKKGRRRRSGASTCSTTSRTGMPISTRAGPTPTPSTRRSSRRLYPEEPRAPTRSIEDHWLWPIAQAAAVPHEAPDHRRGNEGRPAGKVTPSATPSGAKAEINQDAPSPPLQACGTPSVRVCSKEAGFSPCAGGRRGLI